MESARKKRPLSRKGRGTQSVTSRRKTKRSEYYPLNFQRIRHPVITVMDKADKLAKEYYFCKSTSNVFYTNMLDFETLIIYMYKTKDQTRNQKNRIYRFLEELGEKLSKFVIQRRTTYPNGIHLPVVRTFKDSGVFSLTLQNSRPKHTISIKAEQQIRERGRY